MSEWQEGGDSEGNDMEVCTEVHPQHCKKDKDKDKGSNDHSPLNYNDNGSNRE